MKKLLVLCGVALLAAATPSVASADVKARKKMAMAGADMEITEYVKGKRTRTETRMSGTLVSVTLQQCDLGRMVQINEATKKYYVMPYAGGTEAAAQPAARPAGATKRGGVVTVTTTITDTGERREMLGMQARHLKMKMVREPGPGACDQTRSTIEMDGWYVDLDGYGDGCAEAMAAAGPGMGQPGCQDEVRTKTVGAAKLGYPVAVTMSMGASASPTIETVELSKAALDASLFEVPAGYTEVASFAELMTP